MAFGSSPMGSGAKCPRPTPYLTPQPHIPPPQAGFNSGDDVHYYNIPGSRTPAVLHINRTSNIGVPGRWVFRVDEFTVTEGPPLSPTVPTPDPTTKRVSTEPTRPDDNGTEEREYICEW